MGRVSGSYASVVRGVSEQNPQSRQSGQHSAQVNLISDPVRGLARRHGSVLQQEKFLISANYGGIGNTTFEQARDLTPGCRAVPMTISGIQYDLIIRGGTPSVPGLDRQVAKSTIVQCFDKQARAFRNVVLGADTGILSDLISHGASAVVNIGRYVYLAANSHNTSASSSDQWGNAANQKLLVGWIRGGAYKRTFRTTLSKTNGDFTQGSYTTLDSSYQVDLDTSDIPADAVDYQKQVNDRVNAYNSAQIAYIGQAAEDITPNNIANKLMADLIANGVPSGSIGVRDGYVIVNNATYDEIKVEDGGDGSLVRGVGNVIENIDLVSAQHFAGKVVKIEAQSRTGYPLYLKAFAKDVRSSGFTEVVWRESVGLQYTLNNVFCFATVENNVLYIAGSASELGSISGVSAVPNFQTSVVGDADSSPLPSFIGKTIDYMGVFQDRLIIGSGSTLIFSRPGDYLNLFRQSVLTVQDDDPWEAYALGGEDDTIRYSVLYDRSLLLYGERYQYIVSGREAVTPTSANLTVASAYEDAVNAPPVASGNFVFYGTYSGYVGKEIAALHQTQPSNVQDLSNSYPTSQQLDTYLAGVPLEIVAMTAPNMVLLRTDRDRTRVYTYSYMDNPSTGERLFDSWSHWEWNPSVGQLIGIGRDNADILMYFLKKGIDTAGGISTWVSCEKFVRDSTLSDYPYVDSLRPYDAVVQPNMTAYLYSEMAATGNVSIAFDGSVAERLIGDTLANVGRLEAGYGTRLDVDGDLYNAGWVGFDYSSFVTPTNPYAKDRNDQSILSGRLSLTKIKVSLTDSSGMIVTVSTRGTQKTSLDFIGRILGSPDNLLGLQPIVTTDLSAFIGGEVRECSYTLNAVKWLPLTVNSIEWTGQFFFNTRRA